MNSKVKAIEFVVESVVSLPGVTYKDVDIIENAIGEIAKSYYYGEVHKCELSIEPQLAGIKNVVESKYNLFTDRLPETDDLKIRKQLVADIDTCLSILESLNAVIREEHEKFKEHHDEPKKSLKELCKEHTGAKGIDIDDLHIGVYMI